MIKGTHIRTEKRADRIPGHANPKKSGLGLGAVVVGGVGIAAIIIVIGRARGLDWRLSSGKAGAVAIIVGKGWECCSHCFERGRC